MQSNARNTSVNWNDLGTWSIPTLLMKCLRHRENPYEQMTRDKQSAKFLKLLASSSSSSTVRNQRGRARLVLLELERVAKQEDQANAQYFDYNKNHPSPEAENQYVKEAGKKAGECVQMMIDEGFAVQVEAANREGDESAKQKKLATIERSRKGQKMNVTAIAGLMEKKKKLTKE